MTTLTNIVAPSNILTASNTATITNKTFNGANNTLTVRLANDISGALPVANGGTGQTSYTEGQLLVGNTTGNTLNKNALTAGTDITITNGNGSITIAYDPPIVYNNSAWAWGYSACGRLGDNTTANKSSPVSVVGGFTNWSQVSSGRNHSLGVGTNGIAWAWGYANANYGVLGDNTKVDKSSPVSVVGGFTDWSQVAAGNNHSLGLRTNGTAWGWGAGYSKAIGDNAAGNKSSPVSVVGGFTDWCQISAGEGHSTAVRTNGTAWAWGYNTCGRLGDDTNVNKSSPVSVVGGFTDWCQVSGGYRHSAGVRQNGTAWAWGLGTCGRLGDNTIVTKSSPVSVVGGFTDWCQISASHEHSVAVRQNGTAWSWGRNTCGRLGDNTTADKSSPVSVVGGFTDWCQVSAGFRGCFSLGVRTNGTAWSWGRGEFGQLGNNSSANYSNMFSSPVSVVGGFTDWYEVSGGYRHSLAIRSTAT